MLKIGHRGACGYEPENTLASFRKAIDLGVDMIELDVYVCKSGELVVIHDDKVDRTTNGKGYVTEQTYDQLKGLDAGKSQTIPLLSEVFAVNTAHVPMNIELKGEHTALPVKMFIDELVENKGWQYSDFLVSSFNHRELKKFNQACPQVPIGALFVGIPLNIEKSLEGLPVYSINLSQEFIDKKVIDEAHQLHMKVLVYTTNDPDDIGRMKKMGVDGLYSNFPDRL